MGKKMNQRGRSGECCAVVAVDPRKCEPGTFRYCTANSILLTSRPIPTRYVDCIWSFDSDGRKWNKRGVYGDSLEIKSVIGYRWGIAATSGQIALLLCQDQKERTAMIQRCDASPEHFKRCHNEANIYPITVWERQQWVGMPVRRCPACVNVSPSRGPSCLRCRAIWFGLEGG